MGGTTCTCGRATMDNKSYCSTTCRDHQRRGHHHHNLPTRQQHPPTPPPSLPPTPRQSAEHHRPSIRPTGSSASSVLNSAFASEDEHQSDIFPASIYHHSSRRASPRSSISGASSTSERPRQSLDHVRPGTTSPLGRSSTPDAGATLVRGYSPMAAGFARLNHYSKVMDAAEGRSSERSRGRAKEEVDLPVRMFGGPA